MEYADLLAAAKRNPAAADFQELRLACTRSPEYRPYTRHRATLASLDGALKEGDMAEAIKAINRLLETYYLDMETHLAAAFVYKSIGNEAKSDYHRKFGRGLLDSIFQSGDGRSYKAAFTVIDVGEEYAVLSVLGFYPPQESMTFMQSLGKHGGHQFDVFQIRDPQMGQAIQIFFNIDIPMGYLAHSHGPGLKDDRSGSKSKEAEVKKRKWWQFWK